MVSNVNPVPLIGSTTGAAALSAKFASSASMGVLMFVIGGLCLYLLLCGALFFFSFGRRRTRGKTG